MREGRLKARLFGLLGGSGALALAEALGRGVPILAYHGVTARPASVDANLRRLHVPRALFERHLQWLSARRRPLALRELLARLRAGEALPPGAVVVTFDDGYRNFATQAWPLLQRHGVPTTLFVPTLERGRLWHDRVEAAVLAATAAEVEWRGERLPLASAAARAAAASRIVAALEREPDAQDRWADDLCARLAAAPAPTDEDRDRLDWDELRALRGAGLDVGSHADRHQPLTARAPSDVPGALAGSREELERELGPGDYALSYPFGARDAVVRAAARAAGFAGALSGVPALTRPGADPFDLPRFLLGADDDLPRLRASLSGLRGLWQRDPWPAA